MGTEGVALTGSPALVVAAWLLTYGLHSTLLYLGAWLIGGRVLSVSNQLRELLWKVALLGGIVTASLQMGLGHEPFGGHLALRETSRPAVQEPGRLDTAAPRRADDRTKEARSEAASPAAVSGKRLAKEPTRVAGVELPAGVLDTRNTDDGRLQFKTQTWAKNHADAALLAGALDGARLDGGAETNPHGARLYDAAPGTLTRARDALKTIVPMGLLLRGLVFIWIAGAVVGLYRLVRARRLLHRRLGPRQQVTDAHLLDTLDRLRRAAGWRHDVRLTWSPRACTPMALAGAEIVLPQRALDELDPEQQESMLAHEMAHIARRDPAWLVVSGVIECLFFFQPLHRLGRRHLQVTTEYLCDEWAVEQTGRRLTLARCLAQIAGWLERPHTLPVACMARLGSPLVRRVQRLLEESSMRRSYLSFRGRALVALLPLLLVGYLAPVVRAEASPREHISAEDDEQRKKMETYREEMAAYRAEMSQQREELRTEMEMLREEQRSLARQARERAGALREDDQAHNREDREAQRQAAQAYRDRMREMREQRSRSRERAGHEARESHRGAAEQLRDLQRESLEDGREEQQRALALQREARRVYREALESNRDKDAATRDEEHEAAREVYERAMQLAHDTQMKAADEQRDRQRRAMDEQRQARAAYMDALREALAEQSAHDQQAVDEQRRAADAYREAIQLLQDQQQQRLRKNRDRQIETIEQLREEMEKLRDQQMDLQREWNEAQEQRRRQLREELEQKGLAGADVPPPPLTPMMPLSVGPALAPFASAPAVVPPAALALPGVLEAPTPPVAVLPLVPALADIWPTLPTLITPPAPPAATDAWERAWSTLPFLSSDSVAPMVPTVDLFLLDDLLVIPGPILDVPPGVDRSFLLPMLAEPPLADPRFLLPVLPVLPDLDDVLAPLPPMPPPRATPHVVPHAAPEPAAPVPRSRPVRRPRRI